MKNIPSLQPLASVTVLRSTLALISAALALIAVSWANLMTYDLCVNIKRYKMKIKAITFPGLNITKILIIIGFISKLYAVENQLENGFNENTIISDKDILLCPNSRQSFKIVPYINLAAKLQSVPHDAALGYLTKWSRDAGTFAEKEDQVSILCLMLFDSDSNAIPTGANPIFPNADSGHLPRIARFSGTSLGRIAAEELPDYPFFISDGVPFMAVYPHRYPNGRGPTPAAKYIEYCLKYGKWSNRNYTKYDSKYINAALEEMLKTSLFNNRLNSHELKFLRDQILQTNLGADSTKQMEQLPESIDVFGFRLLPSYTNRYHYYNLPLIEAIRSAGSDLKKIVDIDMDMEYKSDKVFNFEISDVPEALVEKEIIIAFNKHSGIKVQVMENGHWRVEQSKIQQIP